MSLQFEEAQAKFTDSTNNFLKIKNKIYNSSFQGGSPLNDKENFFINTFKNTSYFLGYPFTDGNINGLFLQKVANYYNKQMKVYPFRGDLQFARMFILAYVFSDEKAKQACMMMYIFHYILKYAVINEKQGFDLKMNGLNISGDINELCQYVFIQGTLNDKYKQFVKTVSSFNSPQSSREQYTMNIGTSNMKYYSQQQKIAKRSFQQIQLFQSQTGVNIQVCINQLTIDIVNSQTGDINISQSCQQSFSKKDESEGQAK